METTVSKNKQGYGYKYTDLAQIHEYLEANGMRYIQFINRIDGEDYIFTKRYIDGKWDEEAIQGCKVVNATLSGKSNPAQEHGSALTYARRYSLLMAFGLATDDDDAESLTKPQTINKTMETALREIIKNRNLSNETVLALLDDYGYEKLAEIRVSDLKKMQEALEKA